METLPNNLIFRYEVSYTLPNFTSSVPFIIRGKFRIHHIYNQFVLFFGAFFSIVHIFIIIRSYVVITGELIKFLLEKARRVFQRSEKELLHFVEQNRTVSYRRSTRRIAILLIIITMCTCIYLALLSSSEHASTQNTSRSASASSSLN